MARTTASLTAQNTGTTPISPFGLGLPATNSNFGFLNLSLSGTWSATVFLQRSFDNGTTWLDVESYTANTEKAVEDYEKGVVYRLFCKTGGFTSGTIVCRLSNNDG
jgi:hypothetical protein